MITKVTHVILYTDNQEAAMEFYVNKFGFKVHTDLPYGNTRWLTLSPVQEPDFELILFQATKPESQAMIGKQAPEGPFLVLRTDDCQKDFERLKAAGVAFTREPTKVFWGAGWADSPYTPCIEAVCTDPHGNLIHLLQEFDRSSPETC
jgi:catechol 2,3-dioxygenase-like lactoylglutathione lyase family enzyme